MRAADPQKLDDLVGRLVGDVGASVTGALIVLGDQLGLYKAMADGEPVTSQQLAEKTGFKERYLREWLAGQASAVGRPHVAAALVERGYFPDIAAVFDTVLDHGKPGYVPHYKLTPRDTVALIHNAGGLAVLAHPGLVGPAAEHPT